MFKKKETERWIYKIKNIYRLHQDTRYEGTRDTKTNLNQKYLSNNLETPAVHFK